VVATDAPLTKTEASTLARMAHDGLALAIRPAHLPFDGDTVFALSLARPEARSTHPEGAGAQALASIAVMATHVLARAIGDGVRSATGLHGVPSARELAQAT
jgi:L-aminopeptidase/D-esterase-like protein